MCLLNRWFEWVKKSEESGSICDVSWGAYHAVHQLTSSLDLPVISSLLPLFHEQAKSAAMIKHGMNIIKQAVEHLNTGQIPVIAVDQPLYSLAKYIQWQYPATHGEDKFVIMFGGLHIEMAFLKVIGDWLRDSGWTEALSDAHVASSGVADSFLKASHVTRTRRAHQVTACSLYILLHKAYTHYCSTLPKDNEPLPLEEWVSKNKSCPTFRFWWIVLSLEILLLLFVKSLREGNFQLYIQVLNKMTPWFFALDHPNYSRWIPVHIRDMATIHSTHHGIALEFEKGHFVVNKSGRPFSRIPTDQAHEQNNASVKSEGGAVGLTQSPSALRRWTVGGPEVARLVNEFEIALENEHQESFRHNEVLKHHEQKKGQQAAFMKDVHSLVDVIEDYGQPFLENNNDLVIMHSKNIVQTSVITTVENIESTGEAQYQAYVKERIIERTVPLSDPIKRNKLPLISRQFTKQMTQSKTQVASLRNDCNLFSRLYISCQTRDGNLEDFFRYENQPFPPSISHLGKLRPCAKSNLLQCLEDYITPTDVCPPVDVTIVDGAAIVNILRPGTSKTFVAYSNEVFLPHLQKHLKQSTSRIDLVWDQYFKNSLKTSARARRGRGVRRRVQAETTIPANWHEFLRIDENKTELFEFLSEESMSIESDKIVIATSGEGVLCNKEYEKARLQPCTHEEADSRMILHLMDAARNGCKRALLRTVDTDVVVLAIACVNQLEVEEVWIAFGVGKNFRYLPAHDIAAHLGSLKSRCLPMFHSITGCDTVSSFGGIGKKTAWQTWKAFDEVTQTFHTLSCAPLTITESDIKVIERFVILLYDRTSEQTEVNGARQYLFTKRNRSIENIPPTKATLVEHIKRAVFQGGHIWGQACISSPQLPDPSQWGWTKNGEDQWEPKWTTLEQASKACKELLSCSCTKGCKGRCKCYKASLKCTALCKCSVACENLKH